MDERGNWSEVTEDREFAEGTINKPHVFLSIGGIINIQGQDFRVRKITKKDVILRAVINKKKI
jgi:hypothetical protein